MLPHHVYVHVPFCARRCTYCDFAIAVRRSVPAAEYTAALAREIDTRFPDRSPWPVDTLYLGGGTPSLLGGDGVARLLDTLRERFTLSPEAEITLEANPDDVTTDSTRQWRANGVNRLSIGAQSFDDHALAWMHRTHNAAQIERAVHEARAADITNLSLDLIFALPESLGRHWERDLAYALALEPSHISLYGLTIEPATPLARWLDRGTVTEAPDERYETEFLHAHAALAAAGFDHYEVSNYAQPGFQSRHNSSYWRLTPYAGFGPAAHSFDDHRRRWNLPSYAAWAHTTHSGRDPIDGEEVLTDENRTTERIYLALRTATGLPAEPAMACHVHRWADAGWATLDNHRVRLTPLGWLRLDALAADLTMVGSC